MLNDVQRAWRRNIDTKVAVSAAVGTAGLGVVAWAMHKSNVKALERVAKISQGKK